MPGLPPDGSAQGFRIDQILMLVHWLILLLFVGWGIFLVYCLVRFRKRRNPVASYRGVRSRSSAYLEGGVIVAEAALLVGFAIPVWSTRVNALPPEKEATVVRVVAEQYVWNIHYPGPDGVFGDTHASLVSPENPVGLDRNDPDAADDIVTINQLNLPVGKPVIIYLTTKDVIHSFNLPMFRVKQDAIPGQEIPVWFTPVKTTAEIRMEMARETRLDRPIDELSRMVVMKDYSSADGARIVAHGDAVTDETLERLKAAGITSLLMAPDQPTEIACAQLCGLGHYRMMGVVTIQTPQEFAAWMAEQR